MLKEITKYRMICFYTKPHESWISFCFVASIFISYLLIDVSYGFITLMALSLSLFMILIYFIVSPIYGLWSSLQIKVQYGPKTLKAVINWIESDLKADKLDIEQVAVENGEYQG